MGQWADWIFCLVRTGAPELKPQAGISFLLIDMKTPGITVSPIRLLDGTPEVNEVHFDNVRVPAANLVGEENRGWTYAKYLLTHERTGIAQVAKSRMRLAKLKEIARATTHEGAPLLDDPFYARRVAEVETDLLALEYTELRALASVSTGKAPGPESSILKIKGTEIAQTIDELLVEAAGWYALPFVPRTVPRRLRGLSRRPRRRGQCRADLLQQPQGLDLRRFERDPAQHHRQGGTRAVMAFVVLHSTRAGLPWPVGTRREHIPVGSTVAIQATDGPAAPRQARPLCVGTNG